MFRPLGAARLRSPGAGADGASLEWQSYQTAVESQLTGLGYTIAPTEAGQIAAIRLVRSTFDPSAGRSPVGVSVVLRAATTAPQAALASPSPSAPDQASAPPPT
jgi:hypothetical protein